MKEIDDITIQRAVHGDKNAFKSLYHHYSPFLWRILFKMVSGDQIQAQELLQDSFVKIHGALKHFRSDSSFSTWAYRIAYNESMHAFARRTKQKAWIPFDDQISGKSKTDSYSDREIVGKLLDALSPQERFLLLAKEVDDFSYDEISEITGQSAGALRTKLHRIKEQLRKFSEKMQIGGYVNA